MDWLEQPFLSFLTHTFLVGMLASYCHLAVPVFLMVCLMSFSSLLVQQHQLTQKQW